jgi:CHAD domain-containing protein
VNGTPRRYDRAVDDRERLTEFFAQRHADVVDAAARVKGGDDVEAVHDLRVAIRRLRTVLRTAGPLLAPAWTEPLGDELDRLGPTLGPLRDLDVLTEHLRRESEELDDADRSALAGAFRVLAEEHAAARVAAIAELETERFAALVAQLATPPPIVGEGDVNGDVTLTGLAARAQKRLRKTMDEIAPDSPDELLHRARIRAKRVRYLAETLGEERIVKRAKAFQDVVGENQDAVVAEERLRALAERVPEAAVPLGRLIEREHERRGRVRNELPAAWKKLERAADAAWA